jgi:uncharacterized protein YecE (DUF72 family)
MTSNRIDEILTQIRQQIEIRRSTGQFPEGYEADVEREHNLQLGKVRFDELLKNESLLHRIDAVRTEMDNLVELPLEQSRFRFVRVIRETAHVRHDVRQSKRQIKEIHAKLDELLGDLVAGIILQSNENDQLAMVLYGQLLDRTLVVDQLIVLCGELEKRLDFLEQPK